MLYGLRTSPGTMVIQIPDRATLEWFFQAFSGNVTRVSDPFASCVIQVTVEFVNGRCLAKPRDLRGSRWFFFSSEIVQRDSKYRDVYSLHLLVNFVR